MAFSDVSIRPAYSGLRQLRRPAAPARPLSWVVAGEKMPEKEVLEEKFPFAPEETNPACATELLAHIPQVGYLWEVNS